MTPVARNLPRRTVLAASGTAVLAAAAACGSPAATSASTSSAPAAARSAAASPAPAVTSSSSAAATSPAAATTTSSSAASTTTASSAAPTGTPIAKVADVESAGSLIVDAPSGKVLLAASNGTVVGHSAVCTHQGCTIQPSGDCKCHGSKFNVTTGAVENGPALQPLSEVAVTASGGQVYAS